MIIDFVAEIDKRHRNLEAILAKYGIEKIAPKPFDIFNAKENEVLMAEVNPDFKKGEIIKTMNSGYRLGDLVLVRANVIAAR
jgi:molecular chaperone GrpE (heat shock protein)